VGQTLCGVVREISPHFLCGANQVDLLFAGQMCAGQNRADHPALPK